jgi:hypothetical protein
MPVTVGQGVGQYNSVNYLLNGEPASQVIFNRPTTNLANRTDSIRSFVNTLETRYESHLHTGDGISEPGPISRSGISGVNSPNGICGLDGSGYVLVANLPPSIVGSLHYQGTWNATTNTPNITTGSASSSNLGWYYLVATAGTVTVDGHSSWQIGDWIVSNGTIWEKLYGQLDPRLTDILNLTFTGHAGWTMGVDPTGTVVTLIDTPSVNAAVNAELSLLTSEVGTLTTQMSAVQSTLTTVLTNVSKEQSQTITNPSGESLLDFVGGPFTWDPSNAVVDIQVYVNNGKVLQDQTGTGIKDFIKLSSTQLQFAETLPKDAVVTVFRQGTSTGGGVGDYTNIPVAIQPMSLLDIGSPTKPWQSIYLQDLTSNQVYRVAITGGEFAATLV